MSKSSNPKTAVKASGKKGVQKGRASSSSAFSRSSEQPASWLEEAWSWRYILDRFRAHSELGARAYQLSKRARATRYPFMATFCIASALEAYGLLPPKAGTLRIAVLGAHKIDTGIDGRLYALLPELLSRKDLKLEVELVGLEYQKASRSKALEQYGLPEGAIYRMSCGKWLKERPSRRPLPDVFFLFHPKFETYAQSWLAPTELPEILKSGKPVIIFSYDEDEAERDAYILRLHGARVSAVSPCAMGEETYIEASDVFSFSFAKTMFLARGFGKSDALETEGIGEIEALSQALEIVLEEEGRRERHADIFKQYPIRRNNKIRLVAHVFGRIYYDPKKKDFFIAQQGVESSDASSGRVYVPELDAAIRGEGTDLDRALLGALIFRELRNL